MKKKHKFFKVHGSTLNGLLLLFVTVLLVLAVFLVRIKLLKNAQDL